MTSLAETATVLTDARTLTIAFITLCCVLVLHGLAARRRLRGLQHRVRELERRLSVVTSELDGMMIARLRQNDLASRSLVTRADGGTGEGTLGAMPC